VDSTASSDAAFLTVPEQKTHISKEKRREAPPRSSIDENQKKKTNAKTNAL
jgi:hypothetical protein